MGQAAEPSFRGRHHAEHLLDHSVAARVFAFRLPCDLHGRNILVFIAENEDATLPAVFDYEYMSDEGLLGWDFVKLEMEVKVRALERIFRDMNNATFLNKVYEFERDLVRRTQQLHNTPPGSGQSLEQPDSPEERIARLTYAIRAAARNIWDSRPAATDGGSKNTTFSWHAMACTRLVGIPTSLGT